MVYGYQYHASDQKVLGGLVRARYPVCIVEVYRELTHARDHLPVITRHDKTATCCSHSENCLTDTPTPQYSITLQSLPHVQVQDKLIWVINCILYHLCGTVILACNLRRINNLKYRRDC